MSFSGVTIFFAISERVVDDKTISSMKSKPWTTNDLNQVILVKREKRISRVETFFALLGTAILGTLYYKASDILGIYEKSEHNDKLQFVEPLFNQDVLLSYWPFVVALIVFEISFILYKWLVGYWTNKMAILNTIIHIVFIMFTVLFINQANIFNVEFINYIGDIFNVENGNIQGMWNKWVWGMVIVVIIFSVLDSFEGFRKSKK